jgi:hypothetical protein
MLYVTRGSGYRWTLRLISYISASPANVSTASVPTLHAIPKAAVEALNSAARTVIASQQRMARAPAPRMLGALI